MLPFKVKYLNSEPKKLSLPRNGDVGIDIMAAEDMFLKFNEVKLVPTGVKVETPLGYWLNIRDRSSNSKYFHVMAGVVDSASYRGEILVRVRCHTKLGSWFRRLLNRIFFPTIEFPDYLIRKGDKIAQLIIMKDYNNEFELEEVAELSQTDRGEAGFGSTGK